MAVRNIFVSQQKYFLEYCCTVSVREGRFKKSLMFIVAKEMLCFWSRGGEGGEVQFVCFHPIVRTDRKLTGLEPKAQTCGRSFG